MTVLPPVSLPAVCEGVPAVRGLRGGGGGHRVRAQLRAGGAGEMQAGVQTGN